MRCGWLVGLFTSASQQQIKCIIWDGSAQTTVHAAKTDVEDRRSCSLTNPQNTDTGSTSPITDPTILNAWQGSPWTANFYVTDTTGSCRGPRISPVPGGRLTSYHKSIEQVWAVNTRHVTLCCRPAVHVSPKLPFHRRGIRATGAIFAKIFPADFVLFAMAPVQSSESESCANCASPTSRRHSRRT